MSGTAIDFGTGPNTPTGDTVRQAFAKLLARLAALEAGAPVADTTPDNFFFPAVTGATPDVDIISDEVTLTGFNAPAQIFGGPYSIDGAPFTSANGTISPLAKLRLKAHSSAQSGIQTGTDVTVGGVTRSFKVTTAAAQAPGTALEAPTIERKTGISEYPVQLRMTRPGSWKESDGIKAVVQLSTDPLFGSGSTITETPVPVNITSDPDAIFDFGLGSMIPNGAYRNMRLVAWTGNRPATLFPSNVVSVGDAIAPVITGGGSASSSENAPLLRTFTFDSPSYPSIGGQNATELELFGAAGLVTSVSVRLKNNENLEFEGGLNPLEWTITATKPSGLATQVDVSHTVLDQDEVPDAFNWVDAGAQPANTRVEATTPIVMGGLGSGVSSKIQFKTIIGTAGQYKKGTGAWTNIPAGGVLVDYTNGTQFFVAGVTDGSGFLQIDATSNGVTDSFNAGTLPTKWSNTDKANPVSVSGDGLTVSMFADAGYQGVRSTDSGARDRTAAGSFGAAPTGIADALVFGVIFSDWAPTTQPKTTALKACLAVGPWGWAATEGGTDVDYSYDGSNQGHKDGDIYTCAITGGQIQFKRNGNNLGPQMTIPNGVGKLKPFAFGTYTLTFTTDFSGW